MADSRRVYVHIGEPKTGTSFLQSALWRNRARLAAQGVVLPGYSNGGHARASQDLREVPRLATDPSDPWAGEWDVLAGQALRVRHAAVISNELLAACGPRRADRAVKSLLPAEVHIIATLRDFASLLPAEWQETVKTRGTVPWEEWLGTVIGTTQAADRRRQSWFWRVHDTLAILAMWCKDIPPDHVHVITVPPLGSTEELWLRFASVLGVESGRMDLPAERANSSLGMAEAEFLRRLNEALPDEIPKWFYTWNIKRIVAREVLGARPRHDRLVLPPEQAAWAREQSEILVAGLRESKYHIVGELDELLAAPATGHYVAPANVPTEQLLEAAVQTAAALADRQYRREIILSSSDLAAWPGPVERRRPPVGVRQKVGRLIWAMLRRSPIKRMIYRTSRRPAVRHLRIAAWRVMKRPGRRRG